LESVTLTLREPEEEKEVVMELELAPLLQE
jgi:hypothetical protein